MSPGNGQRMDAWPPDGSHPGSDLPFMQMQLLDKFNVAYGLLAPLVGGGPAERNIDFGAAMATAVNDWQLARFCDPDPRLKAAVQINIEHEKAAIAEIEARAGDRRFAQVNIPPRSIEPLGRRRYWPILEACAANDFPVSLHLGGTSGPRLDRRRLAVPSITRSIRPTCRAWRRWSPAWCAKACSSICRT